MVGNETILFSTAGKESILVALPETKQMGRLTATFAPTPGVEVNLIKSFPNQLRNGIETINVYEITLKAEAAVQRFAVHHGRLRPPVVTGAIEIAAHPYVSAEFCHVEMPLGALNGQPISLAVYDQSASTGHTWQANVVGPLKFTEVISPHADLVPGEPAVRLYNILPTEEGLAYLHLQLIPPGKQEPAYCVNFSILAKPPIG